MVERKVTYTLEVDGQLILIENVLARVSLETGEQFFSPETVARLQQMIGERKKPSRMDGSARVRACLDPARP